MIPTPTRRSLALAALALSGVTCARSHRAPPAPAAAPPPPTIASTEQLLSEMRRRYEGKWYRTLSVVQTNVLSGAGGAEQRIQWARRVAVPGRQRIDYLPLSTKSGLMYVDGRVHVFDNGRQIDSRPAINATQLLEADVYVLPVEGTTRALDSLGIDRARFREASWQGRPAFVVGAAAAADSTSSQFWVDADRLLLVRLIQAESRAGGSVVTDTRVARYVEVEGIPVPAEVQVLRDGRPLLREEYANVRVNESLPDAMFDPSRFAQVRVPPA